MSVAKVAGGTPGVGGIPGRGASISEMILSAAAAFCSAELLEVMHPGGDSTVGLSSAANAGAEHKSAASAKSPEADFTFDLLILGVSANASGRFSPDTFLPIELQHAGLQRVAS
jgi:hypothetical protein